MKRSFSAFVVVASVVGGSWLATGRSRLPNSPRPLGIRRVRERARSSSAPRPPNISRVRATPRSSFTADQARYRQSCV